MSNKLLHERMYVLADRDNLPEDHPVRIHAKELENALINFRSKTPSISISGFIGAWARCRQTYCNYTGEELI